MEEQKYGGTGIRSPRCRPERRETGMSDEEETDNGHRDNGHDDVDNVALMLKEEMLFLWDAK